MDDEENPIEAEVEVAPVEHKFDIEKITWSEPTLAEILAKGAGREAWKPDISTLPDAIDGQRFLLKAGDRLLIQYPDQWRDTVCWTVRAVFDEVPEGTVVNVGHIRLFDPYRSIFGATNYLTATDYGLILKVADKSRSWIPTGDDTGGRRRRKRKDFVQEDEK